MRRERTDSKKRKQAAGRNCRYENKMRKIGILQKEYRICLKNKFCTFFWYSVENQKSKEGYRCHTILLMIIFGSTFYVLAY